MNQDNKQHFLTTSPLSLIIQTSWPLLAAIFLLLSYDLAESSYFANQDHATLTAYGFIMPILTLLYAIAIAIAVHTNMVLVKEPSVKAVSGLLIFAGLNALVLGGLLYFSEGLFLDFLGFDDWLSSLTQNNTLSEQLKFYLNYRIAGWLGLILVWQSSAIMRTFGHHRVSAGLLLSWMLCKHIWLANLNEQSENVFIELGQIHFFSDLGFAFISLGLLYYFKHFLWVKTNLKCIFHGLKNSFVLMLQQLLTPLSITLLMAIAARYDSTYVGAFAIIFRLEPLLLVLPMVLTASLPACVGLNFWHGCKVRSQKLICTGFKLNIVFQIFVVALIYIYYPTLTAHICPDSPQTTIINSFISFVPLSYTALGLVLIYPSTLNAISKPKKALIILGIHRLSVPLFVLFAFQFYHLTYVLAAFISCHIIVGLYCYTSIKRDFKLNSPIEERETVSLNLSEKNKLESTT